MKYVGLLSGGKDSCFNLLHCHNNGHQLVAAASLGPIHGKEEIDSYLYQTVGQDAIEFVAEALDVPLYRQTITGTAVEQGPEYGARIGYNPGVRGVQGDETEDLYELLSTVKGRHPDIQGVSVGAILSNYQRVRVEHVCHRLHLTVLSYLWWRDQAELISEMIDAGMHAIIIKVAGIGLAPNHLGKTLAEMQPTLVKLNEMYGSHICGEGGEYESLTLDCPLFKKRITVTDTEVVTHSDHAFATVAYLRIKDAVLEPKLCDIRSSIARTPLLLDPDFLEIQSTIAKSSPDNIPPSVIMNESVISCFDTHTKLSGSWIALADICSRTGTGASFEQEVKECFQILQDRLAGYGLDLSHCTNISIFLSSMDLFPRLNNIYATFFGTSPPARACVAVDLPPPTRVKFDCIAFTQSDPLERKALHVQGLSYWAPANIGPYSQAIHVGERVFISGQIGLIPSSLSLPYPTSLATEAALAFQHVERVVTAVRSTSGGGWEEHTQLALYWLVDLKDAMRVCSACKTYTKEDKTPTLFIGVPALPKGALVEKQAVVHTGRQLVQDEDEMSFESQIPEFEQGRIQYEECELYYEASKFKDSGDTCAVICVRDKGSTTDEAPPPMWLKDVASRINPFLARAFSVRLFYTLSKQSSALAFCDLVFEETQRPPITTLPLRFILTKTSESWDYALCIIAA